MRKSVRVQNELMREDGRPNSRAVAALARRISVIRWFWAGAPERTAAVRVAEAVTEHAQQCQLTPSPTLAKIVDAGEGVRLIAEGVIDVERPPWQRALHGSFHQARAALLSSQRIEGHPLFFTSGEALFMRPEALPVRPECLWNPMRRAFGQSGSIDHIEHLVDRTLWELGAMLAWELVSDVRGPNPFLSLLGIYEEGLYPLDLIGPRAILWAPGAKAPESEFREASRLATP